MVDLLASYFFDRVIPTLSTFSRSRNETIHRTTLESVPGKRRPSIPLYVLTSRDTGSAAEDFAFLLQQTGRATLVGDRTAGAGHMNAILQVGGGYALSVSIGRTFNPKTNHGWEGTGVIPEVKVPPPDALEHAHRLALTALLDKATTPALRQELAWTRDALDARRSPVAVDAVTLRGYAGRYGARRVHFENGQLWYQRAEGAERLPLLAVSSTQFALGEGQRLQFVSANGTMQLRLLMTDGSHLAYDRSNE
jgi:retinol-binding protein 3